MSIAISWNRRAPPTSTIYAASSTNWPILRPSCRSPACIVLEDFRDALEQTAVRPQAGKRVLIMD
ncbi:MAG: hypothetical protein J0I54_16440 [Bosea sp.]|uniref:hypothetical protein n=1 Tax=unclassified Bosea (in: a-proteobacteria) TaxID=2653178 RepID=UPI001ACED4E7|nr:MULTISPECIES: hypothetical protein [unclassified Bosea (in: a-proteobacteria)]MBN9458221.1 hypothetical protein [Bosea sp. (in: a-proteobacteria)]